MKKVFNALKTTILSIIENDFFGMAAEMGFWLVIGIFPFMLFMLAIFNWIGKHSLINPVYLFLSTVMPEDAIALIKTVMNQVTVFSGGDWVAIFGLCVTVALSTNAIAVVLKGLNRAYKLEETRSLFYTRVLSLIMVFVNIAVLFISINLIVFGKVITQFFVEYFNLSPTIGIAILTFRWPVAFLSLFLMSFLQYYILPDFKIQDCLKRKSTLPGTLFFCVFWLVGSWGFSIYVNNLHTYNIVYGTIGAFAVLMVWLYYSSMLMLIGGEINYQVYKSMEYKAVGRD